MLCRFVLLKISRECAREFRCIFKIVGREGAELLRLHKARKELIGDSARLLHLLGRELQAIKDAREVGRGRLGHDVGEVDILAYARKVDVEPREINSGKIHTGGRTGERGRIERECAFERGLVDREHAAQVHTLLGLALQLVEGLAGKDIGIGMRKLLLDNLRIGSTVHKLERQSVRVGDTRAKRRGIGRLIRLDHANNAQVNARVNLARHEVGVIRHIGPSARFGILAIDIGGREDFERSGKCVLVGEIDIGVRRLYLAVCRHGARNKVVELVDVQGTDAVERVVAHGATARKYKHRLVGRRGPVARHNVILRIEKTLVVDHLVKDIRAHRAHASRSRRAGAAAHRSSHGIGHELYGRFVTHARTVDDRSHTVVVLDSVDVLVDAIAAVVQPFFEARHVVGFDTRKHVFDSRDHGDLVGFLRGTVGVLSASIVRGGGAVAVHHGGKVVILTGDRERVARKRILLDLLDVIVHAV